MTSPILCPYPACSNPQTVVLPDESYVTCECDSRQPVARCESCNISNRAAARYCRRCGSILSEIFFKPGSLRATSFDVLGLRGGFRRPPVAANGFLYALSTDGAVQQLSPRKAAKAIEVGRFAEKGVGFNRGAVVDAAGDTKGWSFLAACKTAVVAMSLVTGKVETLYEPRTDEEISANGSDADATGFRGLAATSNLCAFAVRTREGDFLLTLKHFSRQKPASQPLVVHGKRVAGPALCDDTLLLCSDEEAGIYEIATQRTAKMLFPKNFIPLLRPSSPDLSVSPGSIPLAGWRGRDNDLMACVAGVQDGIPGTLHLDFRRNLSSFQPRPKGSSIYTNGDGSLSINLLEWVERIGHESTLDRTPGLQPGMPACFEEGASLRFAAQDQRSRHRLLIAMGSQTADLSFEDARCTKDSCCGIYTIGRDVLATWFDASAGDQGEGLRLAHWGLL